MEYLEIRENVNTKFVGYIPNFHIALIHSILVFQDKQGLGGDLLELGVYRGKTAALLLHNANDARVYLVDLHWHFTETDWNLLNSINRKLIFIQGSTGDIETINKLPKQKFRFVHCDTSHTFVDTYNDLKLASDAINESGIICVDDFCNLDYPGVLPATYKFLIEESDRFRLFLVSHQKAFICKIEYFNLYSNFISFELLREMKLREEIAYLARTDVHFLSECTHIGQKSSPTQPDIYGDKDFVHLFNEKT